MIMLGYVMLAYRTWTSAYQLNEARRGSEQKQIGYRQGRLYSTHMRLQNRSSLASASSTREAPIRLPRAADKVAANIPMYTNPDHRFTSCRKL